MRNLDVFAQDFNRMRRIAQPPTTVLTPSQMAASEMLEGAHEADRVIRRGGTGGETSGPSIHAPIEKSPRPKFNTSALLSGIGTGLDNAMKMRNNDGFSQGPVIYGNKARYQLKKGYTPPFVEPEDRSTHPFYEPIRGLAQGGIFDEEEEVIVGEHGPEILRAYRGGGGEVQPLDDTGHSEPYGVEQTMQGDDTPIQTQQGRPDARTLLLGEINNEEKDLYEQLKQAQIVKSSKWKDVGFGILQGLNNALNHRNDPIQGWGEMKRNNRVAPIAQKISILEARKKALRDEQLAGLEITKKTDDIIFGRTKEGRDAFNNDPDVMVIKESKRVTPAQAERLNAKYGTQYTPQYWGTYIEKQVEGGAYVRPADNPNYIPNTSIPVERTETVVETDLGNGQKGYLTAEDAVKEGEQNKRFNASTAIGIATENENNRIEIDKANVANQMKYADDVRQALTNIASANADILASAPEMQTLARQTQAMADRMSQAAAEDDQEAFDKAQAAFQKAEQEFQKALGKATNGRERVKAWKQVMPTKPKKIAYKPLAVPGGKVASSADVSRFAKQFKVSPERAKKHFIDSGYTIQ